MGGKRLLEDTYSKAGPVPSRAFDIPHPPLAEDDFLKYA
jgi:hypothetical protein